MDSSSPRFYESGLFFLIISIIVFFLILFKLSKSAADTKEEEDEINITPLELLDDAAKGIAQAKRDIVLPLILAKDGKKGKSKVTKQKSNIDNEYYFVAADLPDKLTAANKLAEVHRRSQTLLQALDEQLDGNKQIKTKDGNDITDNMRNLVKKHYKKRIPFAELHNPNDKTVGSNSDKGMLIEMCLRNKYDPSEWNSDNTLFRVHVHELAHSADHVYREDHNHGPEFERIMNYLLQVSENVGIYSCSEYIQSRGAFCGLTLTELDTNCKKKENDK